MAWAGWWIKGPARARLEPSGTFPDASAIRWKTGGLGAMGFTPRAIDFKRVKHDLAVTGETITHESADELDASLTIGSTTLQCFYVNRKVGKVAVGCWTVACVRTDAELARAHAICDSLTLR